MGERFGADPAFVGCADRAAARLAPPGINPGERKGLSLLPRQTELFGFICSFFAREGHAPSIEEMGAALGYKPPNFKGIVSWHLRALEERGRIRRRRYIPRSIDVLIPADIGRLRFVNGPGHWEDRARIKRAEYAREAV